MSHSLDLNAFLGHSGRSESGKYTKDWKDRPGFIEVFLHRKAPILALWRHPVPMIKSKEITDKRTDSKKIVRQLTKWQANCHEEEITLKNAYKTDRETGARLYPPCNCGLCKFIDYIRMWVLSGDLDWLEPIFEYDDCVDYDLKQTSLTLRAGGLFGMFNSQKLTDDQKDAMKSVGVYPSEAYKYKITPNLNYVFQIVNADAPNEGVTLSTESVMIGDKTKQVIFKEMGSRGAEEGNPMVNPYAIRWDHYPKNNFDKKYDASPKANRKPTPEILDLLNSEPHDTTQLAEKYDAKIMRAELERHCVLQDIPWDDFFPPSENMDAEPAKDERPSASKLVPEVRSEAKAPPAEATIPCDTCKKPMAASASKCPHCGQEYEVEEEEKAAPPPPPPPPPEPIKRRRGSPPAASDVAAASAAVPPPPEPTTAVPAAAKPKREAPKPPPVGSATKAPKKAFAGDDNADPLEGDDLPF